VPVRAVTLFEALTAVLAAVAVVGARQQHRERWRATVDLAVVVAEPGRARLHAFPVMAGSVAVVVVQVTQSRAVAAVTVAAAAAVAAVAARRAVVVAALVPCFSSGGRATNASSRMDRSERSS
jgi:hypothetical protein